MRAPLSPLIAMLAATLAAGPACMEPLQNGGVDIIGDPSSRIGTLCKFRHRDGGRESFCANDEPTTLPARVRRIASASDGLKGPHATGKIGDYILENEEIAVVIDQHGSGQGFAESGGNIIDAGSAKERMDALGQVFASFGMSLRQPVYASITSGVESEGAAWIEATGKDTRDGSLHVSTRYVLTPGARAVTLTTTVENTGANEVAGLDLGDAVLWGGAANGAPGPEAASRGDSTAPYVFGVGRGVAYALAGDGRPFFSKNGASWSTPVFVRGATIAPGAKATYERMLIVAPRGDTAAVASELFFLSGGTPGGVEVELTWDGKGFLRPNENRISLRRLAGEATGASATGASAATGSTGSSAMAPSAASAGAAPFPDPPSLWLSPPIAGSLAAELAPGRYVARFEGTAGTSKEVAFDVAPARTTKVALEVKAGGLLHARVVEAEPAALEAARAALAKDGARTTLAVSGKPTPAKIQVFDPVSGTAVVAPVIATAGQADIALPAGRYRIVASRGPELTIDEALIDIGSGTEAQVDLGLARVVDTRGYIGCDLRPRPVRGFDTPMTLDVHLAAAAAEGVECAVASERDAVAAPGPIVDALGLGAQLRAFAAGELGAAASREPVRADPFEDVSAHAASPSRVDRGLEGFWALLRKSRAATPTASAFSRARWSDPTGDVRTYVAVADDDPAKLTAADLVAGLETRRDVTVTNGPFVTMRLGDVRQGSVASLAGKRRAEISVRIERAPWVDATELTLFVGGIPRGTVPLTGAKKSERGALLDEHTFTIAVARTPAKPGSIAAAGHSAPIAVAEDTFAVAVVRGRRALGPVHTGSDDAQPFAVTAPLWLDTDGDGVGGSTPQR